MHSSAQKNPAQTCGFLGEMFVLVGVTFGFISAGIDLYLLYLIKQTAMATKLHFNISVHEQLVFEVISSVLR